MTTTTPMKTLDLKDLVESALGGTATFRGAANHRLSTIKAPVFAVAGVPSQVAEELASYVKQCLRRDNVPEYQGTFAGELTASVVAVAHPSQEDISRLVGDVRHARRDSHGMFLILPGERGAALAREELAPFFTEGDNLVTIRAGSQIYSPGDQVRFAPAAGSGNRWWTVRAVDERHLVATCPRPFDSVPIYTVVDLTGWTSTYNGVGPGMDRSSLNTLGGSYDVGDHGENCAQILTDLREGTRELSHRRVMPVEQIQRKRARTHP